MSSSCFLFGTARLRSPLARRERLKILTQRADALLAEARHMDVELDEVIKLLRERHEILTKSQK